MRRGTARNAAPHSGWLSSSDAISHGRFAPGTIFDDRYRIVGVLGRGGMGEVYRADDLRLGQPVALKFLPPGLSRDPVRLAQFHNEVRLARQISHQNVCRVYDIGEADGLYYFSLEYVDGEDLASSLRRVGRFPEDRAAALARQLCAGLAAAHERGVIHRDLKPANVMLDGAGRVRVMDFGLAAIGEVEDVRAGTPAYMAPEQLLGREVTARSDVFALGLVLYELFTGRRAFTATTVGELVNQHEVGPPTPSTIVTTLDPAIERAILRCLDPDPSRRPVSALAVAAALSGGDPLAAALAAGETPSPEMVAAAGEGVGLGRRAATAAFVLFLAGLGTVLTMALSTNPLDQIQPEYPPDVLVQKARDAVRRLGYPDRPRDEAYGFMWDTALTEYILTEETSRPRKDEYVRERPSPLLFWFRQSPSVLTGLQFHSDLLTPGIVDHEDPPPILAGMIEVRLDHEGRLTRFEAIPPQVEQQTDSTAAAAPDWGPLLLLAGLDPAQLQPAAPQWNWIASADTRAAWTGSWPGSGRPLRAEAAALHGRPVAFIVTGPWQRPWRTPQASSSGESLALAVIILLALSVVIGAFVLAWRNVRTGRGDRRGAFRLAACMTTLLLVLWIWQVHPAASAGLIGTFFIAICTSLGYGVFVWTIYIALEPFVRRHWPQTLVSWTNMLAGHIRDPIVGRDVLFGALFGLAGALMFRAVDAWFDVGQFDHYPGWTEFLTGFRATVGMVLQTVPGAIRTALFAFFWLFLLRLVLRNQWAAAAAFVGIFFLQEALGDDRPWLDGSTTALFWALGAFTVLRWGLLSFVSQVFFANLFLNVPVSGDLSAWYMGHTIFIVALTVALASWAFHTSLSVRPFAAGAAPYR